MQFGASRATQYPFTRLTNDGLWELDIFEHVRLRNADDSPREPLVTEMREHRVRGGFTRPVFEALRRDSGLVRLVARGLLDRYFDPEVHAALVEAVGLDRQVTSVAAQVPEPDVNAYLLSWTPRSGPGVRRSRSASAPDSAKASGYGSAGIQGGASR